MGEPGAAETALEELQARREIEDVVLRYCRGVDRLDREVVRSCYHPDATDEHGSFSGGVEGFVDWAFRLLERYSVTMHCVANMLVERRGDAAVCETYGVAFHRSDDPRPELNLVTGFRFLDRFERRDGQWRIARRIATTEWSRVDERGSWWPLGQGLRRGRRDRGDALYALLAELDG